MRSFTDGKGRTYELTVTVLEVKLARDRLGVRLDRLFADGMKPLAALLDDLVLLVDLLYLLCERQAAAKGVTDEEFGRSLAGDALQAAADALVDGCVELIPGAASRAAARAAAAKGREFAEALAGRAAAAAAAIDVAAEVEKLAGGGGG